MILYKPMFFGVNGGILFVEDTIFPQEKPKP